MPGGGDDGKKRAADRQITKDEYVDPRDVVAEDPGTGMPKADAATLAKRKIVRGRRPNGSFDKEERSTDAGKPASGGNPFASTVLVAAGSESDQKADAKTKPVFGAGFSGFGAAKAGTPGPGTFGFGFGSKSSTTSTGFGMTASGFGTAPSSGFGFKKTKTEDPEADTGKGEDAGADKEAKKSTEAAPSLFGAPTKGSATSFNFGKSDGKETKSTSAIVALPDQVELTTGEETEKVLHTVRCKSFRWVRNTTSKETKKDPTTDTADAAADDDKDSKPESAKGKENAGEASNSAAAHPSVPPSMDFNNKKSAPSLPQKKNGDTEEAKTPTDSKADDKTKEGATDLSGTKDDAVEEKPQKPSEAAASVGDGDEPEFKWQEIGIGPIRILQESDGKADDHDDDDDDEGKSELERQAAIFMSAVPDGSNDKRIRLVQRRESTPNGNATKVIINIPIWQESTVATSADKFIRLTTPDPSTGHASQYLFKFKTTLEAATFKSIAESTIDQLAKSCVKGAGEKK